MLYGWVGWWYMHGCYHTLISTTIMQGDRLNFVCSCVVHVLNFLQLCACVAERWDVHV